MLSQMAAVFMGMKHIIKLLLKEQVSQNRLFSLLKKRLLNQVFSLEYKSDSWNDEDLDANYTTVETKPDDVILCYRRRVGMKNDTLQVVLMFKQKLIGDGYFELNDDVDIIPPKNFDTVQTIAAHYGIHLDAENDDIEFSRYYKDRRGAL